jgi:hypothetical protein
MAIDVTQDEADKRAASVRKQREEILCENPNAGEAFESLQLDRTAIVNPQKGKAYHLVNRATQSGARIQVLKGHGYKVTPENDPAQLLYGAKQDGGQVHGDLILMETDRANYEKRRSRKMRLHDARLGVERETARENMNKMLRDSGHAPAHKDATFDDSGER